MITVHQIYFDDKTEGFCEDPPFRKFHNPVRDEFFENTPIRKVYEEGSYKNCSYIGITAWKQQRKTRLSATEIIDFIQADITAGRQKDIYIYSPVQSLKPVFNHDTKRWHATIKDTNIWEGHTIRHKQLAADDKLLNDSGVINFDLFDGKWNFCHCNYWIVKPYVFEDYCKNVLIPAMDFYNRPEIMNSLPKWDTHRHEQRKTTSICYTLEGLFGSFLAHNPCFSFDYIVKWKFKKNKYHFIHIDGFEKITV